MLKWARIFHRCSREGHIGPVFIYFYAGRKLFKDPPLVHPCLDSLDPFLVVCGPAHSENMTQLSSAFMANGGHNEFMNPFSYN